MQYPAEPTLRQLNIYEYILAHVEEHGCQPSFRQIGAHHGISSPNGVLCHLRALERKGLVRLGGRAIELVGVKFRRVKVEAPPG